MKIFLTILLFVFTSSTHAQISYLCVPDSVVGFGFNKVTKSWTQTHFEVGNSKYLLSLTNNRWEWKKIGDKYSLVNCGQFSEYGVLNCDGVWNVQFNKNNLRFMQTYLLGYVAPVGNEGSDTPHIFIGKCSPM